MSNIIPIKRAYKITRVPIAYAISPQSGLVHAVAVGDPDYLQGSVQDEWPYGEWGGKGEAWPFLSQRTAALTLQHLAACELDAMVHEGTPCTFSYAVHPTIIASAGL